MNKVQRLVWTLENNDESKLIKEDDEGIMNNGEERMKNDKDKGNANKFEDMIVKNKTNLA